MDIDEIMRTTWANRRYLPTPVPGEVTYRVLDNARFAPSGGNRQPWRVVVVTDAARRRQIRDLYLTVWRPYHAGLNAPTSDANHRTRVSRTSLTAVDAFAKAMHQVPVHLVVCVELAQLQLTDSALDRVNIVGGASIYPFIQNILLASRAEGLGAALTTLICRCEPDIRELLHIPASFAVAGLVTIGYPAEPIPRRLTRNTVEEFTSVDDFDAAPLTGSAEA